MDALINMQQGSYSNNNHVYNQLTWKLHVSIQLIYSSKKSKRLTPLFIGYLGSFHPGADRS